MTIIRDAASGEGLRVDSEGRALVEADTESMLAHVSDVNGRSFAWATAYNYGAGDNILGICNDSASLYLHICCILMSSDTTTGVQLFFPATIAAGGPAVVGTNLNRTSGNVAEATAIQNAVAAVVNVMGEARIPANAPMVLNTEGAIILGLNDCFAVVFDTVGTDGRVTISGFYTATLH